MLQALLRVPFAHERTAATYAATRKLGCRGTSAHITRLWWHRSGATKESALYLESPVSEGTLVLNSEGDGDGKEHTDGEGEESGDILASACESPAQASPELWSTGASMYTNPISRTALTLALTPRAQ